MLKRLVSIWLSVLITAGIFTIIPFTASANTAEPKDNYDFNTLIDGTLEIDRYLGSDSIVNIPSAVDGKKVTKIGESAFAKNENLISVSIPDSIQKIGAYAFSGCTNLSKITLPKKVLEICGKAFINTAYYNNENNWDNNVLYIGNHLIKAASYLSGSYSVKPGTIDIANSAFYELYFDEDDDIYENRVLISSVNIPSSVKQIGYSAFYSCRNLTSVTLNEGITTICNSAFYDCTSLKSIKIPKSVTSIDENALGYYSDDADESSAKNTSFKIFGYKDSAAEDYAKENEFTFVTLNQKKKNTLTVKAKTKTVKLKTIKKKSCKLQLLTVKKAKGKVTYIIIKKGTTKKIRKYIKISKKGKVTVKRWKKAKKGTYKIKITVTASGSETYYKKSKTVTAKVKIKK